MTFMPVTAFLLFPAMLILLELGHRFRIGRKDPSESKAVETAVFALFGLLLAFTFSGAISRYDAHRALLVQETNDIGAAYLRLDLLAAADQPAMRQMFRDYTTSRLHLFDTVAPETSPETKRMQRQIWKAAVIDATGPDAKADAAKLLLPAINDMIAITSTRQNAFNMHPPAIVYLLLFALSCVCAFMAGYSMPTGGRSWLYFVVLALTVTLTVYATLEVEYPRRGLIRFSQLDKGLIHLRDTMK